MGQYGNQPDFATKVSELLGDSPHENLNSAAIYIGAVIDPDSTETSITVLPVGNTDAVTFSGLTSGSFIPVIVNSVVGYNNIDKKEILLIY